MFSLEYISVLWWWNVYSC